MIVRDFFFWRFAASGPGGDWRIQDWHIYSAAKIDYNQ